MYRPVIRREKGREKQIRPICIGLVTAAVVSIVLVCVTSAVFSVIEVIAKKAVAPLSLIALAIGCFVGAFICAAMTGRRGLVMGAIIGAALFALLVILSFFDDEIKFSAQAVIKACVLIFTGCCGGYLGMSRRYGKKGRR